MEEDRRLGSWKEIACYFDREVRTVQRWERDGGLPVHRLPGGEKSRVYAYTSELDQWLADGRDKLSNSSEPPSASITAARKMWIWVLSLAVVLVGTFYAVFVVGKAPAEIADFRIEGNTLTALDSKGTVLWERSFPAPLRTSENSAPSDGFQNSAARLFDKSDLDGDEIPEILVVTGNIMSESNDLLANELICLDHDGEELWTHKPGRPFTFGDQTLDGNWRIFFFTCEDLIGDEEKEILLITTYAVEFPSTLTLLNARGEVRGEYVHSGHIKNLGVYDLEGDGQAEIVCVAINNEYNKGSVFVLDPRDFYGASPQTSDYYRCADVPSGKEKLYLLLPRDPVNRVVGKTGKAVRVFKTGDYIVISTDADHRVEDKLGGMDFQFNRRFELQRVSVNSGYPLLYRHLVTQGLIENPYSREEILADLEPILYWNGAGWTTQPTMKDAD